MGYEIGTIGLITTLGYGQGAAPPPPPPVQSNQVYGPALTQSERNRWFGYYGDPDEEKKRKKALERARRLELGIIKALPPVKAELLPEVKEIVSERVFQVVQSVKLDKELTREIAKSLSLDLKSAMKEGKRLREVSRLQEIQRLEEADEDEAFEAITLWMMN
jgi:hypothetical protein